MREVETLKEKSVDNIPAHVDNTGRGDVIERKCMKRRAHWTRRVRAWGLCAALAAGTFALTGCGQVKSLGVQTGLMESPYYHLGDTQWDHGGIEEYYFNSIPSSQNEIYRELYSRLANREDKAELYAAVSADEFWSAYYSVMADHPEFFWVGPSISVQQNALSGNVVSYEITSLVDPEQRDAVKAQLDQIADECINSIDPTFSEYGKIKAVYEYLINRVDYDTVTTSNPRNQSAVSALIDKSSVCAGYSRAFQYILHRMGRFCTYVTGNITGGGEHAWNIVRIDGNYYNVDVTWGDPVFAGSVDGGAGDADRVMNYNYLCCTDAELALTHTVALGDPDVTLPSCTMDNYNYYKVNGMYYEGFDYNTVYNALMNSVWEDRDHITMKFSSQDAYNMAVTELFTNKMTRDATQYLMETYGQSTWNYRYNTDDAFRLITIYWK